MNLFQHGEFMSVMAHGKDSDKNPGVRNDFLHADILCGEDQQSMNLHIKTAELRHLFWVQFAFSAFSESPNNGLDTLEISLQLCS